MNYNVIAASIKKTIIGRRTKSIIIASLLAASSAFAQVPSYVPTNGLVGWWPFNGNANDESGNGNDCNNTIGNYTLDRFGNLNSSFFGNGLGPLPGSGMYITSLNNFPFGNANRTISVWFKCNLPYPGGLRELFSYGDNTPGTRFGIMLNGTEIGIEYMSGSVLTSYIADNNWHNLIVTYNGNGSAGIILYIDGVLKNSNVSNPIGTLNTLNSFVKTIGRLNDIYNFSGDYDDIGIWNRALTQQEITTLYNAQTCNSSSNTITADGPTTFCAGNYVNLTSDVVGGTYQWKKNGVNVSSNGTSRTYKATATGSYTCVATCNGTALTSNAIQVTTKTNAFASVTASGATSFCAGDSVTLNCTNLGSNYSVQWYRTNISMENANNYSQVVKQPGTYKVVTKNLTTGCSRISGSAITTNVNCRIAGDVTSGSVIQENTNTDTRFMDNELSQGVHIFPNPNSGVFSFNYDGEETGDAVLQIINNMGQSIYQSRLTVQEGGFTQDLQLGDNITKGIYIVRLLINDSYHDSKVMVK
ncbi:MAG: LamG-like jellyroll fold domain-containing protein [Bacteroidota bacterium]